MEYEVDLQEIVNSLSEQVAGLIRALAVKDAIIKSLERKINGEATDQEQAGQERKPVRAVSDRDKAS